MNTNGFFTDKRVLVTGACGSVGSELIKQIAGSGYGSPAEILGIDNNESALFFEDQKYLKDHRISFALADVRDYSRLRKLFNGIDIVFHTAALKHVVLTERDPSEAVSTNVTGVQNVADAAVENGVAKVIFTSSDKAVNPTNVMGTSKLMGERLITAANNNRRKEPSVFASTRFGNVLGSSGSVFPIFKNQIAAGGPVTLTDTEMTRFVMSIEDSVKLVIESAMVAKGGEVFVTKMPVVKIVDLAKAMIKLFAPRFGLDPDGIELVSIGSKPGEKLYEELMSDEETRRAVELEKFFAVLPAFRGIYHDIEYEYDEIVSYKVNDPYVSETQKLLSVDEIVQLMHDYGLVNQESTDMTARYWPGDKEESTSN